LETHCIAIRDGSGWPPCYPADLLVLSDTMLNVQCFYKVTNIIIWS